MSDLATAMRGAEAFLARMNSELADLSAQAEESGDYAEYDERAADLREEAAEMLAGVVGAWQKPASETNAEAEQ